MNRIKALLRKFLLLDILQGLMVTLKYYFSRKVTIPYPEKLLPPPERFRGLLRLFRDEKGAPLCIACKACQRVCPDGCFDIEGKREPGAKIMRPVKFDWKLDRCSFCGLCVEVCPTDAIQFSKEFKMTSWTKESLFFHHEDMYLGGEALQERFCGGCGK
jgi:NADH-quinone oxidoreductase subunit I